MMCCELSPLITRIWFKGSKIKTLIFLVKTPGRNGPDAARTGGSGPPL
jgi:hypothetical protein